jgi:hypothetical protein
MAIGPAAEGGAVLVGVYAWIMREQDMLSVPPGMMWMIAVHGLTILHCAAGGGVPLVVIG